MVERGLPKPETRVRFPSPAPLRFNYLHKSAGKVQEVKPRPESLKDPRRNSDRPSLTGNHLCGAWRGSATFPQAVVEQAAAQTAKSVAHVSVFDFGNQARRVNEEGRTLIHSALASVADIHCKERVLLLRMWRKYTAFRHSLHAQFSSLCVPGQSLLWEALTRRTSVRIPGPTTRRRRSRSQAGAAPDLLSGFEAGVDRDPSATALRTADRGFGDSGRAVLKEGIVKSLER